MTATQASTADKGVSIISEAVCENVIGRPEAFTAVEKVFAAMAKGDAYNFPVVREAIGHADALYGFKSGFDRAGMVLGLKSGGYWPGNTARNLTNHQSTIMLFDPDTGKLASIVGANYLTALRTAAAKRTRQRTRQRALAATLRRAARVRVLVVRFARLASLALSSK